MLLFAKSRVSLVVSALCMVVCHAASAQLNLSITALDDMPAGGDTPPGVRVQVNAKDLGGTSLFTTTLFWDGNDNTYTTQVLSVPAETRILRFTHLLDCCGSNGPGDCGAGCQVTCDAAGNPDCDRNAFIDSFTLAGSFREGEDFDRTASCGISTVQGRVVAACGLDGAWVEYDVGPSVQIPTVSEWGLTVMVILVLSAGTTVFMRRWPKQV